MPEEESVKDQVVLPGSRLSLSNKEFIPGPGTYEMRGYIYSSLAGVMKVEENEEKKAKKISVSSYITPSIIPKAGDIITARVNTVNSRLVQCVILCVAQWPLARPYRGVLKKEDIRATDKDRVDPYKCYRPGDIILARVLPMTEIHCYHLSTAENELGVAIATAEGSPQGTGMVPLSWSEMQCPKTLVKEPRKVARILPENINEALFPVDSKRE